MHTSGQPSLLVRALSTPHKCYPWTVASAQGCTHRGQEPLRRVHTGKRSIGAWLSVTCDLKEGEEAWVPGKHGPLAPQTLHSVETGTAEGGSAGP